MSGYAKAAVADIFKAPFIPLGAKSSFIKKANKDIAQQAWEKETERADKCKRPPVSIGSPQTSHRKILVIPNNRQNYIERTESSSFREEAERIGFSLSRSQNTIEAKELVILGDVEMPFKSCNISREYRTYKDTNPCYIEKHPFLSSLEQKMVARITNMLVRDIKKDLSAEMIVIDNVPDNGEIRQKFFTLLRNLAGDQDKSRIGFGTTASVQKPVKGLLTGHRYEQRTGILTGHQYMKPRNEEIIIISDTSHNKPTDWPTGSVISTAQTSDFQAGDDDPPPYSSSRNAALTTFFSDGTN